MKEQILSLLASGVAPSKVASAVGCSPSYISQLSDSPAFQEKLSSLKEERDSKLDAIEDKIVAKLEKSVDLLFKPMEVLKYFQVVNQAKRSTTLAATQLQPQQIVNIQLPSLTGTQFKLNAQNQVIQAGDQTLITLPTVALNLLTGESNNEDSIPNSPPK